MLTINTIPLAKSFKFPGGEVQIRLPKIPIIKHNTLNIRTTLNSSDSIMELLLVKDALDITYPETIKNLEILYFPYARQDRQCSIDESFSLSVMVRLINNANFNSVLVADPHNLTVLDTILERATYISAYDILSSRKTTDEYDIILSPDAGAHFRANSVATLLGIPYIGAVKHRVASTGNITNIELGSGRDKLVNARVLIVDDICDGGRTFIELMKEILPSTPKSVHLYVTHGIFSKGVDCLFKAGIKKIITTNSVHNDIIDTGVEVIRI